MANIVSSPPAIHNWEYHGVYQCVQILGQEDIRSKMSNYYRLDPIMIKRIYYYLWKLTKVQSDKICRNVDYHQKLLRV